MEIVFHGGKCCGIKHICDLGYMPHQIHPGKRKGKPLRNEAHGYMRSNRNWYYLAAPAETYLARLDRYIAYLDEKRPQNVSEIVLSDFQLVAWRTLIEQRGYKLTTKAKNSNSGQNIHIYHRVKE